MLQLLINIGVCLENPETRGRQIWKLCMLPILIPLGLTAYFCYTLAFLIADGEWRFLDD